MFELHLSRWPCGRRWEPGQGCLTPPPACSAGPPNPHSGVWPAAACPPRHLQEATEAPLGGLQPSASCGLGLTSHHAPRRMGSCAFNSLGVALLHRASVSLWRQNW